MQRQRQGQGNSSTPIPSQVPVHVVCAMHILNVAMVHATISSGIVQGRDETVKKRKVDAVEQRVDVQESVRLTLALDVR